MKIYNRRLYAERQNEECKNKSSPEKSLWAAVLSRAIRDSIKYKTEKDGRSARRWINNHLRTDFRSFRWVCEVLDIEERIGIIVEMANRGEAKDHDRLL